MVMLVAISDTLAWNVSTYWRLDGIAWMKQHDPLRRVFYQEQYWMMFSPEPLDQDYWLKVPATLADGSHVDLYTQASIPDQPPDDLFEYYGSTRVVSYIYMLVDNPPPGIQERFIALYVRRWESAHPAKDKQVVQVSLVCTEFQRSPGASQASQQESTLLTEHPHQ
jgi:hypothetical protein